MRAEISVRGAGGSQGPEGLLGPRKGALAEPGRLLMVPGRCHLSWGISLTSRRKGLLAAQDTGGRGGGEVLC